MSELRGRTSFLRGWRSLLPLRRVRAPRLFLRLQLEGLFVRSMQSGALQGVRDRSLLPVRSGLLGTGIPVF